MTLSVLTIVKNRADHLARLVEGLRRSVEAPLELIIVDMASDPPVPHFDAPFPVHIVRLNDCDLPLAAARNAAANAAMGEELLFLDVDCIPMRELVCDMRASLLLHDALICAEALYLQPGDARGEWDETSLRASGKAHPVRDFPAAGLRAEPNAGLFWSLIFGIRRTRFVDLGGFDEAFTGYGAEDTDFGFRAREAGLPLLFKGGSGAFHQYHDVYDPPFQHFRDIVRNAVRFRERWGFWPMAGWLEAFGTMGLILCDSDDIVVLRDPHAGELENARLSLVG